MRYAAEGNFLYNQLANVYDANVELVGNNIFKPGQYVYINTSALGAGDTWHRNSDGTSRSWANLMGLGGYHLVTKVRHSITPAGYTTTMDALFSSSGDGKGSVMDNDDRVGDRVIIQCADLTEEIKKAQAEYEGG